MIRLLASVAALASLTGCHPAGNAPTTQTNAAAMEASLEEQANAMEAQADAAADRNAADALTTNVAEPGNEAMPQPR